MFGRIVVSIAALAVGLQAASLTLKQLEKRVQTNSALYTSLRYERLWREAQSRANIANDPLTFSAEGVRAYPDGGKSGNEFAVGISKSFKLPDIRRQEMRIARLANDAAMSERGVSMVSFLNNVRWRYHNYCIERKAYELFSEYVDDVGSITAKKRKAYELEEISRMDLVRLEMEYRRLKTRKTSMRMHVKSAKEALTTLMQLPPSTRFTCNDLYPLHAVPKVRTTFAATSRAYKRRILSEKEKVRRYTRGIDRVEVYANYTDEIDTQRYGIGIAVPLAFASEKNEAQRAAAMYRASALEYAYKQTIRQKRATARELRYELEAYRRTLKAIRADLHDFDTKLYVMLKRSFALGEISATEYIWGVRQRYELLAHLFETQQDYYRTLFRYMTVLEVKEWK